MHYLVMTFLLLGLPAYAPVPPDWRAGLPEPAWAWIHYVHVESGESRYVLAAAMYEESQGLTDVIGYCCRWRINPPNEKGIETLSCARQCTCQQRCRKRVWADRLDIGPWQLRQPAERRHLVGWMDPATRQVWPDEQPGRVRIDGTYPIKGWRWITWYNHHVSDQGWTAECALQWRCSSVVMAAIVEYITIEYAPKDCRTHGSQWPNERGAWLAHYAGGGKYLGCDAREARLESAYLGLSARLRTLEPHADGSATGYEADYYVLSQDGPTPHSKEFWYASVRTGQMIPGSAWFDHGIPIQ